MGKNRTQMRSDLRLDLSDSGSTWSDPQLNRCIERSVSDLSRYLPRQRSWEKWFNFAITNETFVAPADTSATRVVNAHDLNDVSAGDKCTIATQPDVPRHLTVLLTDANLGITLLTLIIRGTDQDDNAVQETFHLSNRNQSATGVKIFKTVEDVEVDQFSGTGVTGDTLSVGIGAFTDTWIYLANKPIKYRSDTNCDDNSSTTYARGTDYEMDYLNGRVRAVSGGSIATGATVYIDYTIDKVTVDISSLPDFIRVESAVYPVGQVPQSEVHVELWGEMLTVQLEGEMGEDYSLLVKYYAAHLVPSDWHPGTVPEFLENTVLLVAGAYALYIFAVKHRLQAATDLTTARTQLGLAATAHTGLGTALTNLIKYLNNNSDADAAGLLKRITDDAANLRTKINVALDAAATAIGASGTSITNADAVWAVYATNPNYLNGGSEPDVLQYLTTGDALLNKVTTGAEGEETPREYRGFAQTTKDALIGAFEQKRADFIRDATVQVNQALSLVQEATQRLSNIRTYIEESTGYAGIANTFAREVESRVAEITSYTQESLSYMRSAEAETVLGDKFQEDADNRRNEVYTIWRDRQQYIGDPTSVALRQLPRNRYE